MMLSYGGEINSLLVIKGDVHSSLWLKVGTTMCVLYVRVFMHFGTGTEFSVHMKLY